MLSTAWLTNREQWKEKIYQGTLHAVERVVSPRAQNLTSQTPHEIIYKDDLLSVSHYRPLEDKEIKIAGQIIPVSEKKYSTPIVLIPPLLAPGFAFDLFPERSLARFLLAKGFNVYLVDFGSPDKTHSHLSFEHYILNWMPASMQAVRKDSGREELTLFGYCMGGLFCLLYTAVHHDAQIKNIVTVASPIDMHQMGSAGKVISLMARPAYRLARLLNFDLRDLDPQLFHIPGRLGTLGFHLTNPLGVLTSYWDLLLNMWDREYITAHESLGQWINNLLDYPGATMQDIIVQMAFRNKLAEGKMQIGQKEAQLKNIRCSMLSFAGEEDKIVPVPAAHKILDVVSSEDKEFCIVPGGHVGVIIGGKSPGHLWTISADWLAKRSV